MKSMHEMTSDHECEVCVNLCVCAPVLTWLWHLWTARLLITWCVFGLCSHSYCIYGCVSAHLTNHTHSHSLRLRLPSPHCHLTYKSLRLFYCQFISLPLILKTRPSYNLWRSIRVCVCARARLSVVVHQWSSWAPWRFCWRTTRAEHQQRDILGCDFPLHPLFSHPFFSYDCDLCTLERK